MVGLRRLDEMADRIHLPESVLEYAQFLYYKMYKRGQYKGIALHTDAKVGACLYIACFNAQCPRTVNEICSISENCPTSIRSAIKKITKLLKLPVGRIECSAVLPRFCAWLDLPHQIEREAATIANAFNKYYTAHDFQVETLSGAAIYYAAIKTGRSELKRSQKDICDTLGIHRADFERCYRYYTQINLVE